MNKIVVKEVQISREKSQVKKGQNIAIHLCLKMLTSKLFLSK